MTRCSKSPILISNHWQHYKNTPVFSLSYTGQEFPFWKNNAIIIIINFGHAQTSYHSGIAMLPIVLCILLGPDRPVLECHLLVTIRVMKVMECNKAPDIQSFSTAWKVNAEHNPVQIIIFTLHTLSKSFQKLQQHGGNTSNQNKAETLQLSGTLLLEAATVAKLEMPAGSVHLKYLHKCNPQMQSYHLFRLMISFDWKRYTFMLSSTHSEVSWSIIALSNYMIDYCEPLCLTQRLNCLNEVSGQFICKRKLGFIDVPYVGALALSRIPFVWHLNKALQISNCLLCSCSRTLSKPYKNMQASSFIYYFLLLSLCIDLSHNETSAALRRQRRRMRHRGLRRSSYAGRRFLRQPRMKLPAPAAPSIPLINIDDGVMGVFDSLIGLGGHESSYNVLPGKNQTSTTWSGLNFSCFQMKCLNSLKLYFSSTCNTWWSKTWLPFLA